ncbi:MAG: selenide, water dikinase SelD [Chloroflexota bacterium]|nr:selenide, water dikinase SelD [Chloroflexota bacterium]
MPADDRVLVDYRTADDAGVYRLEEHRALVQTVDFFTPIVDDPFTYGEIAAANALSDVYAMGGRPLTALAVAGFPKEIDTAIVRSIFSGGLAMLQRAGVALLGGHTVQDQEIKFGYAITGEVDPARMWTNAGAEPGDSLYLTKPLGTGIIATALKGERAPAAVVEAAIASMRTLNRAASEALQDLPRGIVHACTDVTGFGLIGHACEMARASRVTLEIDARGVPLFAGLVPLVSGNVPGGGHTNAAHFASELRIAATVDEELQTILHDPQTSGGLLIAVGPGQEAALESALFAVSVQACRVGRVGPGEGFSVRVQ